MCVGLYQNINFSFTIVAENANAILDCNFMHNHPLYVKKLCRQVISNTCKQKATEDISDRPKIINSVVASSPYKEHFTLRDIESIRQNINRGRQRLYGVQPRTVEEVHDFVISNSLTADRGESFVLDDDRGNNIIIFGGGSNIDVLSECNTYYMYGIFKYYPRYFHQLFTKHGIRNGHYIPLIFCTLPNKLLTTYTITLNNLINSTRKIK